MEEESPKITVNTTEKVKNPKRVEQGKKLAAISRESKERKAREREAQIKAESKSELIGVLPYVVIVPVIGLITYVGVFVYDIHHYFIKKEEPPRENVIEKPKPKLEQL